MDKYPVWEFVDFVVAEQGYSDNYYIDRNKLYEALDNESFKKKMYILLSNYEKNNKPLFDYLINNKILKTHESFAAEFLDKLRKMK